METCTAGSASGLGKRTSGNADTALQADSTNRHRQRWTPADSHGRSIPDQVCSDAGSSRQYLASDEEANYADQPWNKKLGSRLARADAPTTLLPLTASS